MQGKKMDTPYKIRHLEDKLRLVSKHFKAVLILGARQMGKSTLLGNVFPQLRHITFDPIQDLYGARADPDLFLDNFPSPLILDEVQFAPELLPAIKRKVDLSPQKGQYFLTGSQNFNILKNIAESLAGRVCILHLGNMTPFETTDVPHGHWLKTYLDCPENMLQNYKGKTDSPLYETLWKGGLPGTLDIPETLASTFFSSYIQTYIERDVRTIEMITDVSLFNRFIGITAALTSQEINSTQLGRDIGISPAIASRWVDLLKGTYLWKETLPFFGNTLKRLAKKRKGYITDTGIACYLQRISSPQGLANHPLLGAIFESFCVNMIMNISDSFYTPPHFYHWRTAAGAEVDLILDYNGRLYPIEIKCKSNITSYDTRGIKAFYETYQETQNIAPALILYAGDQCYRAGENITVMPWNALV
jgi:predicted AAA+ superfamily ATPase